MSKTKESAFPLFCAVSKRVPHEKPAYAETSISHESVKNTVRAIKCRVSPPPFLNINDVLSSLRSTRTLFAAAIRAGASGIRAKNASGFSQRKFMDEIIVKCCG